MDLRSLTLPELEKICTDTLQIPKYRAKQIFTWLHVHLAESIDEMTNLPLSLRQDLRERFSLSTITTVTRQVSAIDGTEKYLFSMHDGEQIESVLMRYRYGLSLCISSQAGCRMGCTFCASTLGGLSRNLTAGEMLLQVYAVQKAAGERISHLVLMGTGEPLDNLDEVLRFITLLTDENGQALGRRNITLSTCGLVPGIDRLAQEKLPITLALSLHAPTDEKRRRIMPVAKTYSIEDLMQACERYFETTGRRITFEYSLIRGENDTEKDAEDLSALARRVHAHVNLIPVNPVRENSYRESTAENVRQFAARLEKNKVNVSIRRVLGRDIDGACGQLRHKFMKDRNE
ncbi:MAG: 23S rRNA (adenine(2503)-C(2))-methyltransferase RlmN [Lachnospiraceae bacterium]|nr:23S rRNA (adenine(2503)-C(2))-methyltransferase RlmN [Lachnospiraceae bacterium]